MNSKNKDNVILVGMPGAGKSTVGVILAKLLGKSFIDSDIVIQQRTRKLLKDLIEEYGMDGFIELEGKINSEITDNDCVVATGGSAVMNARAMQHFKNTGIIVYLDVAYDDLSQRLGNLKERGVVCREGQTLSDIYKERVSLYEKYADITICENTDGDTARKTAESAADAISHWNIQQYNCCKNQ